jgi:hypothetical protein
VRRSALHYLGVLDSVSDAPWVVSVFELEIICELSSHPAELTGYIAARRALDDRVLPYDELELWLLHLSESLRFEAVDGTTILVLDRVSALDDHLVLGAGPAPRMKLKRDVRRALERESASRQPGWLRRCEALITQVQQRRPPTSWPVARISGLRLCAPRDPFGRPRRISDVARS